MALPVVGEVAILKEIGRDESVDGGQDSPIALKSLERVAVLLQRMALRSTGRIESVLMDASSPT